MTTIDELLDSDTTRHRAAEATRDAGRIARAGLYWTGWAVAKLFTIALLCVGGALYGVGWLASRIIWPGLVWAGSAMKVGWEDGRHRPK